jgi:glycosyltransferase involved in cell wall biosynthesis
MARTLAAPAAVALDPVLIFRQMLLPISETFVSAQASALTRYRPRFAGFQPASRSLPLPADTIYLTKRHSPASRARKALYDVVALAPAFHRRIGDAHPVLVHAHFGYDGAAALPLIERLRVPMVVTLHGFDVHTSDECLAKTLAGRHYLARRADLWARASTFVCVSKFIAAVALARGFPAEKLRVHYIGVDRARFEPAGAPREPVVLFVGRLTEVKGCEHALRAMQRVSAALPAARMVVIGDGPLRASLERLAAGLGIPCEFLGACDNDVVRSWMRRAALLCVPSITTPAGSTEALGIVSLEAQASGTPVAGFRSGGIPEAVLDGSTGILVRPGDDGALAAAMLHYLTDEAAWRAASARGAAWVAERFDLARQTLELESIYDDARASYRREHEFTPPSGDTSWD